MPTKNYFKRLNIVGKYDGFEDFYDDNKEVIYKSIIEVFREFKTTRKKTLTLYVTSKIRGMEWDTEFNFKKGDTIVLKRDLIPYFEEIEDYDTCCEIRDLQKELTV